MGVDDEPTEESGQGIPASERADMIKIVRDMGFSFKQAEAGLEATEWRSAEEAIEVILAAGDGLPKRVNKPSNGLGVLGVSPDGGGKYTCPACGKVCGSKNGFISHRTAKKH